MGKNRKLKLLLFLIITFSKEIKSQDSLFFKHQRFEIINIIVNDILKNQKLKTDLNSEIVVFIDITYRLPEVYAGPIGKGISFSNIFEDPSLIDTLNKTY